MDSYSLSWCCSRRQLPQRRLAARVGDFIPTHPQKGAVSGESAEMTTTTLKLGFVGAFIGAFIIGVILSVFVTTIAA
jgi:hypothetical protein